MLRALPVTRKLATAHTSGQSVTAAESFAKFCIVYRLPLWYADPGDGLLTLAEDREKVKDDLQEHLRLS